MGVQVFNDNSIPYGSFIIPSILRGQTGPVSVLTNAIMENFTVQRPTKEVERTDQIGGPNGFALVNAQESATGVIQIATSVSNNPQRGDYFTLTVDAAIGAEKWVIKEISQPYEMNGYWKQNVQLKKAYFS